MLRDYFLAFVSIFVAVDALGMMPVFLSLTAGFKTDARRALVRRSTFTAVLVAVGFLAVGRFVFQWLGVGLSDFLVAGGVILFVISLRDLLAFEKSSGVPQEAVDVVPLAVPLMVGPAVLTSSIVLVNSFGVLPTLFALLTNLLLCGVVLHYAEFLTRLMGDTGTRTLSKISSLLLGAIGVMLVRRGVLEILTHWFHSVQ